MLVSCLGSMLVSSVVLTHSLLDGSQHDCSGCLYCSILRLLSWLSMVERMSMHWPHLSVNLRGHTAILWQDTCLVVVEPGIARLAAVSGLVTDANAVHTHTRLINTRLDLYMLRQPSNRAAKPTYPPLPSKAVTQQK